MFSKNNKSKVLLNFLPNIFIMFNLPYRNPKMNLWVRSNPFMTLSISSEKGIPYGIYARLILIFIVTEAIKKKTDVICLGDSFSHFVKKICHNGNGGKQNSLISIQLQKLLDSKFTIIRKENNSCIKKEFKIAINTFEDIYNNKSIILNKVFYEDIIARSVPIKSNIVQKYINSPLFFDLYMFLSWRTYNIKKTSIMKIDKFKYQLGDQYKNISDFNHECYKSIRMIKKLCPFMNIDLIKGHLILYPKKTMN